MPTLEIKFAIAILIAVFRFGASHSEIDIQVTHPEKGMISHVMLLKDPGGFSIAHDEEGRFIGSGFVTTFPENPNKLQFGEPGFCPSVDLSKIIKNFNQLHFDQGEFRLEAEVEGNQTEFQAKCQPDEIVLFNEASKMTFRLKGK